MRTVHMTDKELTIRQIGEFCTNTLCKKCPVAKWNEEMPDNVQMLGAIVDVETVDSDEYSLAQQIVEKTGVTYENVIAPGAFDQFINKLAGVPTTVFIDKNGKVVGEAIVGAKVEEYKQQVADYLNEQK